MKALLSRAEWLSYSAKVVAAEVDNQVKLRYKVYTLHHMILYSIACVNVEDYSTCHAISQPSLHVRSLHLLSVVPLCSAVPVPVALPIDYLQGVMTFVLSVAFVVGVE